jgi:hypothetical protein
MTQAKMFMHSLNANSAAANARVIPAVRILSVIAAMPDTKVAVDDPSPADRKQ